MDEIRTPPLPQDAKALASEAHSMLAQINAIEVRTPDDYQAAAHWLTRIKSQAKALTEKRLEVTRPLDEAKRNVMAWFKGPLDRLATAESGLKRKVADYQAREAEARRKAQAEAEEKARKARERLEARAAKAEASGKVEKALELHMEAAAQHAAPVVPPPTKAEGVSTVTRWVFEVTNPAEVPREFLTVDEKKIRGVVQALKGETNIPGVRVWPEQSVRAKASPF